MIDHLPDEVSPEGRDLREYTDELRSEQALVKNTSDEWVLLRYADVVAAARDNQRFSSAVSAHLQIPNGLDGERHTRYRKIIDQYLSAEALAAYMPVFETVAAQLMQALPTGQTVDAVSEMGAVFAVRAQCAWLGWPEHYEAPLLQWMADNHAATRSKNRDYMAAVAQQFDDIIRAIIEPRRERQVEPDSDITTRLCHETIDGRLLTEAELISILRNWTGGDLGSIALCFGVLAHQLAQQPELIEPLRQAENSAVDAFIDETLRLDSPFPSNRRITTCPVRLAGHEIPAGSRVKLHWTSANRDEAVFNNNEFSPVENQPRNIVYGVGKHVCPGRLLATSELRIMLRALLSSVQHIALAEGQEAEREIAPLGGFHRVPLVLS